MMTYTAHEPSTWMRQRLDECIRQAMPVHRSAPDQRIVMSLGPNVFEAMNTPEDFTCDRCRTYCPEGVYPRAYFVRTWLCVTAGFCDECFKLEGGKTND